VGAGPRPGGAVVGGLCNAGASHPKPFSAPSRFMRQALTVGGWLCDGPRRRSLVSCSLGCHSVVQSIYYSRRPSTVSLGPACSLAPLRCSCHVLPGAVSFRRALRINNMTCTDRPNVQEKLHLAELTLEIEMQRHFTEAAPSDNEAAGPPSVKAAVRGCWVTAH
jgi:hypothetical protein